MTTSYAEIEPIVEATSKRTIESVSARTIPKVRTTRQQYRQPKSPKQADTGSVRAWIPVAQALLGWNPTSFGQHGEPSTPESQATLSRLLEQVSMAAPEVTEAMFQSWADVAARDNAVFEQIATEDWPAEDWPND